MNSDLPYERAREILALLQRQNLKLVCAESCTAGLVAATLGGIPGASNSLCGSAVVYRNQTKIEWIGVSAAVLEDPTQGDVCKETAIQMARGALSATSEATVAVSVTGHLGPGAPSALDGVAYLGWAERDLPSSSEIRVLAQRIQLQEPPPGSPAEIDRRVARQQEATLAVLLMIRAELLRNESERARP